MRHAQESSASADVDQASGLEECVAQLDIQRERRLIEERRRKVEAQRHALKEELRELEDRDRELKELQAADPSRVQFNRGCKDDE